MLIKNSEHTITIEDIGNKGEGIGRQDNFVIFADNCLPGDVCEVKILKSKKSYAYGKVLRIVKPSPKRVSPPCTVSSTCGGCSLMHMDYESQLEFKRKKVIDSLMRIGGIENPNVLPIEPMEHTKGYRNKAQVPVRSEKGSIKIGYYAKNSHRIVESESCYIQSGPIERIICAVRNWMSENGIQGYNEEKQSGLIRHILLKQSFSLEQTLVCLILNEKPGYLPKNYKLLIEALSQIQGITSILFNYNNENTNVVMGNADKLIWGKDHISDVLGDMEFKISAQSFFQVNPVQALKMYECAVEYSEVSENDIVIDAYSGIGTISLFFARKAMKVYGIEILPEAIEDARYNAHKNGIVNAEFFCGESEKLIFDFVNKNIKVDILITDPPRKGCDKRFLEAAGALKPDKIIYISCNPDTLARDIAILSEYGYCAKKIKPFDMFSHTTHVECVCLLERKA